MLEFWYDYVKPKYRKKGRICYMVTDSFIAQIKTEGSYEDIAKDVETRFDVSNYELYRPSPKEKNEKVFLLIKDELGGKIMKQSAA